MRVSSQPVIPADKAVPDSSGKILWYDLGLFALEGKGWDGTQEKYDRLPAKAEKTVRPEVWNLSKDAAGLCVRFLTDATAIKAKWTLGKKNLAMDHFPANGVSGIDLYVKTPDGHWRWCGVGRTNAFPDNEFMLMNDPITQQRREYLLYLPLYNQLKSLQLGFPNEAEVSAIPLRPAKIKPIVFYGTSITQGGCASRPGMPHVAQLGRALNREVINLGFSGNAIMEPEMAELLAELDPALYVIDCLPNLKPTEVTERMAPFVRTLRKSHPKTPILLVDTPDYQQAFLVKKSSERMLGSRMNLKTEFNKLKDEGLENIFYLPGENLFGSDGEATVDGTHPSDLGFVRQAAVMEPVIRKILKKSSSR
ncbi:MAG: SGNH/GDSL hydrolase family protein [Fibrobacterota bacterium]